VSCLIPAAEVLALGASRPAKARRTAENARHRGRRPADGVARVRAAARMEVGAGEQTGALTASAVQGLGYRELQALCKEHGLGAKGKADALRAQLLEHAVGGKSDDAVLPPVPRQLNRTAEDPSEIGPVLGSIDKECGHHILILKRLTWFRKGLLSKLYPYPSTIRR